MRERNHLLVKGGHYYSIRNAGPFEIGTDFEPPTPAGRTIWELKLEADFLEKLDGCLSRARFARSEPSPQGTPQDDSTIYSDAFRQSELANGVREALKWYVSDFQFQPDEKIVRKKIKKLKTEIDRFKSLLPEEYEAVGKFIYDTYTGDVFLRDDLKPAENDLILLQDAWRERFGFIAFRDSLDVMIRYVTAAEECLGKRKPLEHRKLSLVRSLARTWEKLTGEWPKSGRDPQDSRQTGPFADFVRTACGVLPGDFKINPLDAAIRRVCERKTRKFPATNSAA